MYVLCETTIVQGFMSKPLKLIVMTLEKVSILTETKTLLIIRPMNAIVCACSLIFGSYQRDGPVSIMQLPLVLYWQLTDFVT